ncbi:MAG: hypothetical protein IPK80_01320 [Nannocystis sp.]|nr:hypothetical protein [Nannocystis sp.]
MRDTNNPGAQQQLSPEDVLIMISRDKEKTRALIEMKRSQAIEAARARIAREANRVLRQAVSRFDRAREADDPEHAARLREDAEQRLSDLKNVDPAAWPWYPWIHVARDVDMLVPELGAPVYEGLRITRPRVGDPSQLDHFEFGAITDASGPKIGLRLAGSATWQLLTYEGDLAGKPLDPAEFPREGGPVWPLDDEDRTAAAIALKLGNTSFVRSLDDLGWLGASDAFLAKWWPRFNDKIAEAFANAWKPSSVPVVDSEGPRHHRRSRSTRRPPAPTHPRRLARVPRARPRQRRVLHNPPRARPRLVGPQDPQTPARRRRRRGRRRQRRGQRRQRRQRRQALTARHALTVPPAHHAPRARPRRAHAHHHPAHLDPFTPSRPALRLARTLYRASPRRRGAQGGGSARSSL